MSIIGCDVDGVLADFNTSYGMRMFSRFGTDVPSYNRASFPSSWHWEREVGLTQSQEDEIWKEDILTSGEFWLNLPRYPWTKTTVTRLSELTHPVYFITSRSGKECKKQTEEWLWGCQKQETWVPTVCVVQSHKLKIDVINGLSITHYIDDRLDTMELLAGNTKAKLYLFDQPWNRDKEIGKRVKRVKEIEEFLKEVV